MWRQIILWQLIEKMAWMNAAGATKADNNSLVSICFGVGPKLMPVWLSGPHFYSSFLKTSHLAC